MFYVFSASWPGDVDPLIGVIKAMPYIICCFFDWDVAGISLGCRPSPLSLKWKMQRVWACVQVLASFTGGAEQETYWAWQLQESPVLDGQISHDFMMRSSNVGNMWRFPISGVASVLIQSSSHSQGVLKPWWRGSPGWRRRRSHFWYLCSSGLCRWTLLAGPQMA